MALTGIPASPADVFAQLIDERIRSRGGPGNLGQIAWAFATPLPEGSHSALRRAWQGLWESVPLLAGRLRRSLRGMRWQWPGRADTDLVAHKALTLTDLANLEWQRGLPAQDGLARLVLWQTEVGICGLVLTWHHNLGDARGMQGLLQTLPDMAAGGTWPDRDWASQDYRWPEDVPRSAAERGKLAQGAMAVLKPLRLGSIWHLPNHKGGWSSPTKQLHLVLDEAQSAQLKQRSKQAAGRFADTAFVLAALAAALEGSTTGNQGDVLFPLAVDGRSRTDTRFLANFHGFIFLRSPAGLASADLPAAAKALKEAQRQWLAEQGSQRMAAALSWFQYLPDDLVRRQLGNHRPGIWASCFCANTGASPTEHFMGVRISDARHRVAVPALPGLAVLFHKLGKRQVIEVIAVGPVTVQLPPEKLAELLRFQLLERRLETTSQS